MGVQRVELGVLEGNKRSPNDELPSEIDPAAASKMAVWCKRFDSTFTEAARNRP